MAQPIAYSSCNASPVGGANVVLAMLNPKDFCAALSDVSDLAAWRDNEEFVRERESAYFGYSTAGITAHLQFVSYAGFQSWIRLTGAPSNLLGLDIFAEHWFWRTQNPNSPIKGILRSNSLSEPGLVGKRGVQKVAILPDSFRRWRNALARLPLFSSNAPTINAYAGFAVETCIVDARSRGGL